MRRSIAFLPLLLVVAALGLSTEDWWNLAWQRQPVLDGAWWRLWSAHFVHYDESHALRNGLALLAIGIWMRVSLQGRQIARTILCAVALTPFVISAGLFWAAPDLGQYRGASGLVAFLIAANAAANLGGGRDRWTNLFLLIVLATAIAAETTGLSPATVLPDGVRSVWQAHAIGALFGLGLAYWLPDARAESPQQKSRLSTCSSPSQSDRSTSLRATR